MKILLDIRSLQMRYSNRGIGTYTRNLVRSLLEADSENEYHLLTIAGVDFPERRDLEAAPNVRLIGVFAPGTNFYSVWAVDRLLLSTIVRRINADVIHFPSYEVTSVHPSKTIVTVHDVMWLKDTPHTGGPGLVARNQLARFVKCVKGAARVVAVSESTKKDLMSILAISEDRIRVTYQGTDPVFRPIENTRLLDQVRGEFGIRDSCVLYVGSGAQNKRVDLLVRAYAGLNDSTRREYQLVLCGFSGKQPERLARDLRVRDRVVLTGIVSRSELSALYTLAEVLVFPSASEGFGLPVLEAMACGTPVIASRIDPLVELADDAATFFEPDDEPGLRDAMTALISDPASRNRMSKRGLAHAKRFSWKTTAVSTIDLYERIQEHSD